MLRCSRYLVFAWVSWMTIMTGKLFFQEYDHYFALFQFWTGEVALSAFLKERGKLDEAIGFKPGPRSLAVRDAAGAAGASFFEIKPKLQALLDAKKK